MPILSFFSIIPILGTLASIANLVLFIVYWVKTAEYKNELKNSPKTANIIS
jgi:hypothetical protein